MKNTLLLDPSDAERKEVCAREKRIEGFATSFVFLFFKK